MKKNHLLLFVLLIAAVYGVYRFKYYLSYASDLAARPWAYSTDPQAKLLVGRWQGSFVDPAGVKKEVRLEILVPVSEEERQRRASRRRAPKGLSKQNRQAFDGQATVKSQLGEETYDLYGGVDQADMHQLSLHFTPQDEAKRVLPNDTLSEAPTGRWEGDHLTLSLAFSRQDAQGFSSSHSEGVVVDGKLVWQDSPEDRQVEVKLSRLAP